MIALLVFASLFATDTIPATPAGAAMTRFLADYDGGKLANDNVWGPRYAVYGRLQFHSVVTSLPNDLRVWTKSEITGTWLSLRVKVNPNDILLGRDVRPVGLAKPPPLQLDAAVAAIDAYLDRMAKADVFSGAVLVARNGTPLVEKAFGFASKRYNVRNDVDTKFNIGSITKLLTAVAVAQLADAGKLAYSDPIRKFLPSYPSAATVEQLLTHSAGLRESRFWREAPLDRFARTIDEQVRMAIAAPELEPGTAVRYSNEGYLLLGAIIEKASGESWSDYVARHVAQPAGMTGSGAFEGDRDVPNLATGYTFWRFLNEREAVFDPRERRNTNFVSALRGNPAAGTYSTVRDLDRLVQAIEKCRIVTCAARDAMFREHVTKTKYAWSSVEQGYGYGVETRRVDGDELVGKSGDLTGVSAQLSIDRRRGVTIVVLSNYDAIAQPVAEWIEETMRRVP